MKSRLEVRDLRIRSRGRDVIRDFSWSYGPGAIAWVVGENGTGKSSLVRALAGRATAAGHVRLVPPTSLYYHPNMSAPEARVRDWYRLFGDVQAHGVVPAADALRPRIDPRALTTQLSTGETKRLVLSELLAQHAANVLLDEPYEHLSHAAKARLTEVLEARAVGSLLVVATNQDVPGLDPVVLQVDGDATVRVMPHAGVQGNASPTGSSSSAAPADSTRVTPITLRTASLLRFDLLRLLRGRLALATIAFTSLLVVGHVPRWRGTTGPDDRLFGYGFMLMLLVAWRLGIGSDRRVAWDEYLVLNHTTSGRYIVARIGAGILTVLLSCAIAFAVAALISGADFRFASWHATVWLLTGLLLFPALLAVELVVDITLPFAIVALACFGFGLAVVGFDRAESVLGTLGLDFGRYAWRELGRLVTVVFAVLPIATVALALLWRRRFRRRFAGSPSFPRSRRK
jgi:iron complex transport system ATP-binding protein